MSSFDIFISYSSKDQEVAHAVCEDLEARSLRCWIAPRDILPGSNWSEGIIQGINNSKVMLLIFSKQSNLSQQVLRELERAAHKELPILPFFIEQVEPQESVEYFISTHHWLDASAPPLKNHFAKLSEAITGLLTTLNGKQTNDQSVKKRSASITQETHSIAGAPQNDQLHEILSEGRLRSWELKRPFYSIGRDKAKISVPDRYVSRRHIALVRLGPDWVAIRDSRTKKPLEINGELVEQKTLSSSDVIKIGRTVFVYDRCKSSAPSPPLKPFSGKLYTKNLCLANSDSEQLDFFGTLEDDDEEETHDEALSQFSIILQDRRVATSVGKAILIGSHSGCDLRIEETGILPFHCLVHWGDEGVTVTTLGGELSIEDRLVTHCVISHGQQLCLGNHTSLEIEIDGDPIGLHESMRHRRNESTRQPAISVFYGPQTGESSLIPYDQRIVLGKDENCDLTLTHEKAIAAQQLELFVPGPKPEELRPAAQLKTLDTSTLVLVNGEVVSNQAPLGLGDVIQFQKEGNGLKTAIIYHLDLTSNVW